MNIDRDGETQPGAATRADLLAALPAKRTYSLAETMTFLRRLAAALDATSRLPINVTVSAAGDDLLTIDVTADPDAANPAT